jgi:hypothetical protein
MKKYKMTEAQFTRLFDKRREKLTETIMGRNDTYRNEIKELDINSQFTFLDPIKNQQAYDILVDIQNVVVTYSIELEYREYGIKSIFVIPISCNIYGVLEFETRDTSFEKDFSIRYGLNGLESEDISGVVEVAGNKINIPPPPKRVEMDSQEGDNPSKMIAVNSIDAILGAQDGKIIFYY